MNRFRAGTLGLVGCVLTGCGLIGPVDVEVRLENASATVFDEATLYTADGALTYFSLAPGATSPYVIVSMAYRNATTQVVVDADTLRLQVIDHVGETPLDGGCYTYALGLEPTTGRPSSLTQSVREGC